MFAAALAMPATVRQLFLGVLAHLPNGYIEIQRLPREVVVGVDGNRLRGDLRDGYHHRIAVFRRRVKLHADLNLIRCFEHFTRHSLHQAVVTLAVAFSGGNGDIHGISGLLSLQGSFETGDDITETVNIREGFSALGAVDDGAFAVSEGVVDNDHLLGCNKHEEDPWLGTVRCDWRGPENG